MSAESSSADAGGAGVFGRTICSVTRTHSAAGSRENECRPIQDESADIACGRVRPPAYAANMNLIQQDLPLPLWGGARRGAGRKRKSLRKSVPHVARRRFRRGALHVT